MPAKNAGISGGAVAVAQENRSAVSKDAFLQPAQRPPKALIPAASMNNIRSVAQDMLPKPLSKQPTKRNAPIAVYNDNQPATTEQSSLNTSAATFTTTTTYGTMSQPVEQGWVTVESRQAPVDGGMHGLHTENMQLLPNDNSRNTASQTVQPSPSNRAEDDVTEPLYLDAVEDLPNDTYPAIVAEKPENWDPMSGGWDSGLSRSPASVEEQAVEIKPSDLQAPRPSSVPIDDQGDLSDYEDDDYDDQGYTTAHSVRDNTTGGVTTVMVPPKLTKKGVAEIAAAKEIVESRRSGDDPEDDESWDISMVIEYGEEIFQYMKEVEVSNYWDDTGRRSVLLTSPA